MRAKTNHYRNKISLSFSLLGLEQELLKNSPFGYKFQETDIGLWHKSDLHQFWFSKPLSSILGMFV